jgi:nicotinamide phosphoribosyltransferase
MKQKNGLDNLLLKTDSYKFSHHVQYPKGTEKVYSYFESRTGAKFRDTVFFGLQAFLKRYLEGQVVTQEKLDEAKAIADAHVGAGIFNYDGWKYILDTYNGYLPIKIKAVPEGTPVTVSNVLMTIENTDPKCFWLTNYLETLLVQVWYPCTVATQSREAKKIILKYLKETGDPAGVDFKLHDFGYRGVSSDESAGMGAMAHLVNFLGTDTVAGLMYAREYYGANMAGFSIPASEHSTITSWGKDHEVDAYENMLDSYPKGLVACVSDSWDIYNACQNLWGGKLKDKVLKREGTLVVRPDSGDPIETVPVVLKTLGEAFGYIVNEKGYMVLPPQVAVIQGDGINFESIPKILQAVEKAGWSTQNIAFGSGGGLLQMLNRDTQRFAFKCSQVVVNGQEREVYKSPVTDPTKNSKKGKLVLTRDRVTEQWITKEAGTTTEVDQLQTVFENGKIVREYTWDEVKANAKI